MDLFLAFFNKVFTSTNDLHEEIADLKSIANMNEVCYSKIHYNEIQSWNVSNGLNGFENRNVFMSLCQITVCY